MEDTKATGFLRNPLRRGHPPGKERKVFLGEVKLSAGAKIVLGDVTLVPIVRTAYACRNLGGGIVCTGFKDTVAILILSPEVRRAVNMDGEEVPLDHFMTITEVRDLVENP